MFYAGQLVTYDNVFKRNDFTDLLEFNDSPILKKPEIFLNNADQGLLNYVAGKKLAKAEITVEHYSFFIGRYDIQSLQSLQLKNIISGKSIAAMIHYYGPKNGLLVNLPAKDILLFYENFYYKFYKLPTLKRSLHRIQRTMANPSLYVTEFAKEMYKKVFKASY